MLHNVAFQSSLVELVVCANVNFTKGFCMLMLVNAIHCKNAGFRTIYLCWDNIKGLS